MRIWAESGDLVITPPDICGGGGTGGDPTSGVEFRFIDHVLCFPLDVMEVDSPVTIVVRWAELGDDLRLTGTPNELHAAALRAEAWS
jgi:hypothetical protein